MATNKAALLQGTLDLLILESLQNEPMHGFGISLRIQQMSKDMLTVDQGSLYPVQNPPREAGRVIAFDFNRRTINLARQWRNGPSPIVFRIPL